MNRSAPISALLRFLQHSFEEDNQWKQYLSNLTFTDQSPSAKILAKYKLKYFAKNIDPQCPDASSVLDSPYRMSVVEPIGTHTSTLIFLHGLGDSGDGGWLSTWESESHKRRLFPGLKVILPSALNQRVTLNRGMSMPAWYDIIGLTPNSGEDEQGIDKARDLLHNLIISEMITTGISSDRIIVAGFSQGGSMALFSGFTFPLKLGGVLGMSSFVVRKALMEQALQDSSNPNINTPFLMVHGNQDPIVQLPYGKMSYELVAQYLQGKKKWKEYGGLGHSTNQTVMNDVVKFINECLST